jgi:hypothetical protein
MSVSLPNGITCTEEATALMKRYSAMHQEFYATKQLENIPAQYNKWIHDDATIIVNEHKFVGKSAICSAWGPAAQYVIRFEIKPILRQWHKNGLSFTESLYCTTVDGQELQWSFDNSCIYCPKTDKFTLMIFNSSEEYANTFFAGLMKHVSKK